MMLVELIGIPRKCGLVGPAFGVGLTGNGGFCAAVVLPLSPLLRRIAMMIPRRTTIAPPIARINVRSGRSAVEDGGTGATTFVPSGAALRSRLERRPDPESPLLATTCANSSSPVPADVAWFTVSGRPLAATLAGIAARFVSLGTV